MRWIGILLLYFYSFASFSYNYQELRIKDYEEMKTLVHQAIRQAQSQVLNSESSALDTLKESLTMLLTRPNSDNMIASLMPTLIVEIDAHSKFINVLQDIVQTACTQYNSASDLTEKANALYVIENSLEYTKKVPNKEADKIFQTIQDSKIKISKELQAHLFMNISRSKANSPSKVAAEVLKIRMKNREDSEKEKAASSEKKNQKKPFFKRLFRL